ncbi:unnamed protein product [Blepharisma stoltei]|uniref:Uncharacterized protein n=1 Tax=Blepharisma stoltei TaxID=1481888 RepID=A0AAU9K9Q2_9CILI|nr:unnamed protein product [Blepharisma stoltei]
MGIISCSLELPKMFCLGESWTSFRICHQYYLPESLLRKLEGIWLAIAIISFADNHFEGFAQFNSGKMSEKLIIKLFYQSWLIFI